MVALQILVLSVWVRVLVGQLFKKEADSFIEDQSLFFYYIDGFCA